jgi:hypothetical protein
MGTHPRIPSDPVIDDALVHRALEIYEYDPLDFAASYLVASAEGSGIATIASGVDRITRVQRVAP